MFVRRLLILLTFMALGVVHAQEFHCAVSVNYQKLMNTKQGYETTDKTLFDNMKQALEDFINNRRWTNLELQQHEKLDCSFSLILTERSTQTDFKGQISFQLRRPVFNSSYSTGMFNYMESPNDFAFTYNESQSLDFDPNNFYSNLTSTVGYYLYVMLGMYFDSYGLNGGEPFYEMARNISQTASSVKGWDGQSNQKSRYWFMENHTNSAYEGLHQAYYQYHRMGLDMMTKDQTQARQNILSALQTIQQVAKLKPGILSVTQFMDVKITEIVSIFTPAPQEEKQIVYEIVKEVSPINLNKMKDFGMKK